MVEKDMIETTIVKYVAIKLEKIMFTVKLVAQNVLILMKRIDVTMPYKIKGKQLLHFKQGHWSVKQTATSHDNAVKAMRLLEGIEHGWSPTGDRVSRNFGTGEMIDGTLGGLMPKRKRRCGHCDIK